MTPMRILVYPHAMDVGGSQLNAIELAGAVRDLGHEVAVIGDDGPLVDVVRQLGLEHLRVPSQRRRPSLPVAGQLRSLVRSRRLDVIHGYEWPPGLEAAAASYPGRCAAVCTVMSMAVAPFLPSRMPLVVGTRALQRATARRRPGPVHLIEPPVDVVGNAPDHPIAPFQARFGLDREADVPHRLDIVIVSRLVTELKLEGILTAIDVVARLGRELPLRLVIVGDGTQRRAVEERAAKANAHVGRRVVVLTGQVLDPRPAYASADVVLGMGGSALRALAFARPLVVQGERGFWELLTPQSCPTFLEQGWYGLGDGLGGAERLSAILRRLAADRALRDELGRFGRRLVVDRFSLQSAARRQEEIYRQAASDTGGLSAFTARTVDGLTSLAGLGVYKVRRRYLRLRNREPSEDFNTVPEAAAAVVGGQRRPDGA